jgi:hypothetical protein
MVLGMKEPAEFARQVEEHPQLPPAGCERVAGSVSVPTMEVL